MRPAPRRLRIPPSRALVCDILHYDRSVPSFAHDRKMDVSALVMARRVVEPRISWPAIFMKAYALNADRFPRLRQTWMNWPWPHLYEHHEHVGTLVVRRNFESDDWLFWGQIKSVDKRSLPEIQAAIEKFRSAPVESIFERQLWSARRPQFLRRLFWRATFHRSGPKRCKRFGTFFLSTIASQGAEIQNPPSVLTSGFTYGPIDADGRTRVTITYDHRMMDGHHVAEILAGLQEELQTRILSELRRLSKTSSTKPA